MFGRPEIIDRLFASQSPNFTRASLGQATFVFSKWCGQGGTCTSQQRSKGHLFSNSFYIFQMRDTMSKSFSTISPIDGSAYVERGYATADDIQSALKSAKKSQQDWRAS